ncbi:MAG TPA: helix-hairpin-helix domain-containing protein [Halanaerobiales bacterium]|nr:helix-hairpin-helix domain-containing protein [Halanaerobiales bacterium]
MININKATIEDLMKIKGIGKSKAENIVEYRKKNGFLKSKEQLKKVKGIGNSIFKKVSDKIRINNRLKVEFKPSNYNLNDLNEVHLVGTMNNWDPADKSYSLERVNDDLWSGEFLLENGDEYKIMYDSISWEEDKYIGDLDSQNIIVKK